MKITIETTKNCKKNGGREDGDKEIIEGVI
jgi:hypothetical protein